MRTREAIFSCCENIQLPLQRVGPPVAPSAGVRRPSYCTRFEDKTLRFTWIEQCHGDLAVNRKDLQMHEVAAGMARAATQLLLSLLSLSASSRSASKLLLGGIEGFSALGNGK